MIAKKGLLFLIVSLFIACEAIPEPTPKEIQIDPHEVTLVFSGDVMQHMPQVNAARLEDGSYDYTSTFQYIRPLWESADWAVVNLETTLAETGRPYSGYPMFSSPQSIAVALKEAGVDVMALANNHTCDRGAYGIRTTTRTIDSLGVLRTGAYVDSLSARKHLVLEKYGFRIGLLNYTYGTNGMPVPKGMVVNQIDTIQMAQDIEAIRRDSLTHLLLFLHWGEEYQRSANREQRELARWCLDRGTDIVIGSHPHVVQEIDTAEQVVYSLGNFVSNQRNRYQDGGISVKVTLTKDLEPLIEYLPHWVWLPSNRNGKARDYIVVPAYTDGLEIGMNDSEYQVFIQSLEDNRRVAGAVDELVL